MRKSRFTDEQIVAALKEHEAGTRAMELCRTLAGPGGWNAGPANG